MESIRKEMINSGLVKGLCHPDTLKSSRRLDTILNRNELVRSIK
ncbi:aspartyl-phosphate phosphatase Spo0E family protein [Alkalihalophilus lindianensis]|uniref:Aspartyl-phosphate phosphatase Spo0E family protein n=1 Tax=Alkalihalophilus lindianensis TaxID=1630542 RepID=A0ABU3XE04_9BACI|nr:aspartyl-phosphate phosphatase Spo0E family protein [Alkalihalophilus lindianensis]MDV2686125.1 aspartyl-phosphate phosphatase Spo0E family protein [Alkalihalophilus lindianensis]